MGEPRLWNVIECTENDLLAGFSDDEKSQLRDYLQRIQANGKQIMAEK